MSERESRKIFRYNGCKNEVKVKGVGVPYVAVEDVVEDAR